MFSKKILILGAGVSGLTCGIRLAESGFSVKIWSTDLPMETTSSIAPAIWFPHRIYPQERVLSWCQKSYATFVALSREPATGVSLIEFIELLAVPEAIPWWKSAVPTFRHLAPQEIPAPYVDALATQVPLIEIPVYLPYLTQRFKKSGGVLQRHRVQTLDELTSWPCVINCTGLAARALVSDPQLYPIRGQIVHVKNPGIVRCFRDEKGPLKHMYIIPRAQDCILGGTVEEHQENLTVIPEISETILKKCQSVEPRLQSIEILEHKVGLRPGRNEVRLEAEKLASGNIIIHNYGHGGGGVTVSWGCAEEVLQITRQLFSSIS